MFHSLDRRFLYAAYKLRVSFDDNGREKVGSGTCFFMMSAANQLFLVTNRHLLDAGFTDIRKAGWELRTVIVTGFSPPDFIPCQFRVDFDNFVLPGLDREDVCAARIIDIEEIGWDREGRVQIQSIPFEILADEAIFENLLLADTVLFPGYPEWHDQLEGRPIMRRGTLSSDPQHNYLGPGLDVSGRILAYEAFSFGGSSGSPIFLPPFGVRINEQNDGNYRHHKLLGINAGHFITRDGYRHHSGISFFYRSTVISELLEQADRNCAGTLR